MTQNYTQQHLLPGEPPPPEREIEIFDLSNPYSIMSILNDDLRRKFDGVDRSLLGLSEDELCEKVKPTPTLNKLRIAFWYEYEICVRTKMRMNPLKIYAGICLKEYFWHKACSPSNLAWLLTPVTAYQTSLEEALEFAIGQIRKMISAPLFRKDGQLNSATANIVLQIYKVLDQRVHGAVTQKIEMKKLSISKNFNQSSKVSGPNMNPNLTLDTSAMNIDQQIAEMEQKLLENRKIVEVPIGKETGPGALKETD